MHVAAKRELFKHSDEEKANQPKNGVTKNRRTRKGERSEGVRAYGSDQADHQRNRHDAPQHAFPEALPKRLREGHPIYAKWTLFYQRHDPSGCEDGKSDGDFGYDQSHGRKLTALGAGEVSV